MLYCGVIGFFFMITLMVDGQRPVYPLFFNGRPPWHPTGQLYRVKGKWVDTSGKAKFCNGHEDCYDQREPDEWCPLKSELDEKYGDVGCFCDYHLNRCVIERQSQGNFQYADCSPKSTSRCNPDQSENISNSSSYDKKALDLV